MDQLQQSLREDYESNSIKNKKQVESEIVQLLSELSNARTESQKKSELISEL